MRRLLIALAGAGILLTGCNFPSAQTSQTPQPLQTTPTASLTQTIKATEAALLSTDSPATAFVGDIVTVTDTASAVPSPSMAPTPTVSATPRSAPATNTPHPTSAASATLTVSPSVTDTQTASVTFTRTPIAEPAGCQRPPDDYTRQWVNGAQLNERTLWMLRYAKTLYKGTIDFSGIALMQGSYNPGGVTASFGTHDGGGAVDIVVRSSRGSKIPLSELPDAIRALRIAGFAAWVREPGDLYPGSPLHIHAIAIGDRELSPAAQEQLTGTYGYFLGYNGLPQSNNTPVPDRHGGPILCQWMVDMGVLYEVTPTFK